MFASRAPFSERVCELGCALFALWTLCAWLVVAAAGSLRTIIALYAAVLVVSAFGLRGIRRRGAWAPSPLPDSVEPPARGVALEVALWLAAAACALYALFAHRVDASDSFAVNLAVAALDRPELPLAAVDTLHGRDDLPLFLAEYRLHSLELGYAALAWLSGVQPIAIFHFVGAALGAAALPLVHAVLLRLVAPRHWLAVLAALLVLLAAIGDGARGYGNTALLTSWSGEAIALFVFVPFVYACAIRFALQPTGRHGALLLAAQIAALGCSATALWAAPLAAQLGLQSAVPRGDRREALRRTAVGTLLSAPLVAAAIALGPFTALGAPLGESIAEAVGTGAAFALVAIAAVAFAWLVAKPGLARRFTLALACGAALLAFPSDVFAGPSHARVLGTVPVPLLLALIVTAPLAWVSPARRAIALAGSAGLVAICALVVPQRHGWSAANHVVWHAPGWKLPSEAARWARLVNERAPGERVLASRAVSTWIPVFRDHAYPLLVRDYLSPERAGEVAYRDRVALTRYATGELADDETRAIFARGLDLYGVRLVCLRLSAELGAQRQALRDHGFRRSLRGARYEIWERVAARAS